MILGFLMHQNGGTILRVLTRKHGLYSLEWTKKLNGEILDFVILVDKLLKFTYLYDRKIDVCINLKKKWTQVDPGPYV